MALLELSTSTSGETAQVEVFQGTMVTLIHEGMMITITGEITEDGIEVTSWKES